MNILVFALVLVGAINAPAQSVDTRVGARHAGMGYASFTVFDEASFFNNIGAIGRLEAPAVFFAYEVVADLPGANRTAAAVVWPTAIGTFAGGVFRFGDDIYSEQILSLAFSNRIGATSLGIKANIVQYRAAGFETKNAITIDFGGLTQITPKVYVGAGIFNVTQSSIEADEVLPVSLVAAIAYQDDNRITLALEVEKKLGSPLRFKGCVEYGIAKKLLFRSGFNMNPVVLFVGLGARTRRANYDYCSSISYTLGFAHQASVAYRLAIPRNK